MPAVAKKSKQKQQKPKGKETAKKQPLILSNRVSKRSPKKKGQTERNEKGIIYVKHLPHGFFENQLRSFFNQFGEVIRIHVARSKKTLRSRGYGYVEFRYREVAQIAAETMNNYLMFNKILKTGLLPAGTKRIPRKYEKAYDANGKETTTYKLWLQRQVAKSNSRVTKTKVVNRNQRVLGKLKKMNEQYAKMGVEYDVDELIPDFDESDLKTPEHDPEEEEAKARKEKKKAKHQQKQDKMDISVQSVATEEPTDEESDDDEDEDASFLPLGAADWDVPGSDSEEDEEEGDAEEKEDQENQPAKQQKKSAAVEFANKTKVRIDKEKKKNSQKRPMVLKPANTPECSPEKPVVQKKSKKAAKAESIESPKKAPQPKQGKKKNAAANKRDSLAAVVAQEKPKGKIGKKQPVAERKKPQKVQKKVEALAKTMLEDPSVKKVKAKEIKKKKK